MGDFLRDMASSASWIQSMGWLPHFNLAANSVPISIIFAALGSFFLGQFTKTLGFFAFPLNFLVLFFGAIAGNWLFGAVGLRFQEAYQGPMLFALVGMTLAALSLMATVKTA
jgi:hypothetical protein